MLIFDMIFNKSCSVIFFSSNVVLPYYKKILLSYVDLKTVALLGKILLVILDYIRQKYNVTKYKSSVKVRIAERCP